MQKNSIHYNKTTMQGIITRNLS